MHIGFEDRIKPSAIIGAFFAYVVVSVIAMIIVVQLWLPPNFDAAQVGQLAETDPSILFWQNILGAILTTSAGALATRLSGNHGLRNSAVLGCVFALYGVISVFLHPSHPGVMQVAKIVFPVPLSLAGGWLLLRISADRSR